MRKFVIGMLFLGLTSLAFGQQDDNVAKEVKLEEVTLRASNSDFFDAVHDDLTPMAARVLESKAANFDLKKSPIYSRIGQNYEVIFRNNQGSIAAVYDKDGDMISAFENIKNVSPPGALRQQINQENPGWVIAKSKYQVTYVRGEDPVRRYKAQLRSGKKKKNLKYTVAYDSATAGEMNEILASSNK